MMVALCVLAGLGLAACGVIIACTTKKRHNEEPVDFPPPLPPRANVGIPSPIVSPFQTQTSNSPTTRPLPPRRSSASATANVNRRIAEIGYGPRGVKPYQFPCCPFDKQRNAPGERQVIFWDSGANCYRCSRGHQFKSNGKLL